MREPGYYWVLARWKKWIVKEWYKDSYGRREWLDNSQQPQNHDSCFLEIDERRIVRQEPTESDTLP